MPRTPKYYTYNKKHKLYQIKKRFGKKWKYFGYYKTEEEAEHMVNELKKVDWNINELSAELQEQIVSKPKHYTKCSNSKYTIHKKCNDKHYHYGVYDTLEEAKKITDLLKDNNWRLSNLSEEELKLIKLNKLNSKYYYKTRNGNYSVSKVINGIRCYFGTYPDEETAQLVVDELKKHNWIISDCSLDIISLQKNSPEPKYYTYNKTHKRYQVHKWIKGHVKSFGYYDTEDEAKQIVELLKQNNWDKECLLTL